MRWLGLIALILGVAVIIGSGSTTARDIADVVDVFAIQAAGAMLACLGGVLFAEF